MSGLGTTGNRGKTFSKAIRSEKAALATQYGAMSGLGQLGTEVRTFSNKAISWGTEVRHSVRQYREGCSSYTVWCHVRAGRTGNRGKTFSKAIRSEKAALATQYGAMSGLGELGTEVRHSVRQYAQRRLL